MSLFSFHINSCHFNHKQRTIDKNNHKHGLLVVLMVDGRNCVQGDANGKQGYYEINCTNAACCRGKTVRLQLLTQGGNYLNFQYVGVMGLPAF